MNPDEAAEIAMEALRRAGKRCGQPKRARFDDGQSKDSADQLPHWVVHVNYHASDTITDQRALDMDQYFTVHVYPDTKATLIVSAD
jgi:hypothetical protein